MKKLLTIIATVTLMSSAYAIQPCGIFCRKETAPLFKSCDEKFATCISTSNSNESKSECQVSYEKCNREAIDYQLACVDRCMDGEDIFNIIGRY
ncbi:MAG: hypothetical protein HQK49_02665 [Oligoflexia bacterium]|nr:hypothetical protein [Oligoflexia bacterium]